MFLVVDCVVRFSCVLRRFCDRLECFDAACRRDFIVRHDGFDFVDCVDCRMRRLVGKYRARLVDRAEEFRPHVCVVTLSVLRNGHRQLEVGRIVEILVEVVSVNALRHVVKEVCVVYRASYRRRARRALRKEQIHDVVRTHTRGIDVFCNQSRSFHAVERVVLHRTGIECITAYRADRVNEFDVFEFFNAFERTVADCHRAVYGSERLFALACRILQQFVTVGFDSVKNAVNGHDFTVTRNVD